MSRMFRLPLVPVSRHGPARTDAWARRRRGPGQVRDAVATALAQRLGAGGWRGEVVGACMERRPGPGYERAGPLLRDVLVEVRGLG